MMLDARNFFVLAEQTPGEVTFKNFEELKRNLKDSLSVFESTEYTPDNLNEAIENREQLKAVKKKLTDKKKQIEKAYTLPYEEVKGMLDELIDMVKGPLNRAEEIIKECEREKKKRDIMMYAEDRARILGDDAQNVILSPAFFNPRWMNATYKIRDIYREIGDIITRASGDIELIRIKGDQYTPALLARYYEKLTLVGLNDFLVKLRNEAKRTEETPQAVIPHSERPTVTAEQKELANALETISPDNTCTESVQKNNNDLLETIHNSNGTVTKTIRITGKPENVDLAVAAIKGMGITVEESKENIEVLENHQIPSVQSTSNIAENPIEITNHKHEDDQVNKGPLVKVGSTVRLLEIGTGVIESYTIKETDNTEESSLTNAILDKYVGYRILWINENDERVEYEIVGID